MKLLSFDQSTNVTGISCFINNQYKWTKLIDLHKEKDSESRFHHMVEAIFNIIEQEKPDEVAIEQTAMQSSVKTLMVLAHLQGAIIGKCIEMSISYQLIEPSKWRKTVGIQLGKKKRTELKFESMALAHDWFDENLSEDASESALIGAAYLIINDYKTLSDFQEDIW